MKFLFVCLLSGCFFLKAEVSSDQISKINTLLKQNADNIKAIQDILTPPQSPQEEDCEVDFSSVKQPSSDKSKKEVDSSSEVQSKNDGNKTEGNEHEDDGDED